MNPSLPAITVAGLLERYDGLLLDAYGVLVDRRGALPGAIRFIDRLNREGRPYVVLTNSASRLPEAMAVEFQRQGLAIAPERILSSGVLLVDHFRTQGLVGARCLVLGPGDAARYLRQAGGVPVLPGEADAEVEALVIADQKGFDCVEGMNQALSLALRRFDAGLALSLILCNPDLIYPLVPGEYGLTAGALAAMLEAILAERYPGAGLGFTRLGKPHAPIFAAGVARLGPVRRPVMVGDQIATDIRGAIGMGIDAVLVRTGLAGGAGVRPTWVLDALG